MSINRCDDIKAIIASLTTTDDVVADSPEQDEIYTVTVTTSGPMARERATSITEQGKGALADRKVSTRTYPTHDAEHGLRFVAEFRVTVGDVRSL